jgi:RNA polymerase subunit RPABC4/transcription elongation factor Spt4
MIPPPAALLSISVESILTLFGLLLALYILVLWFSAVVWTYRDVRNRTDDPSLHTVAVLLVALFNLPGLIVYLVIRPSATLSDAYERSLETEAILQELQLSANSCHNCQRPIQDDFNVCPHCRVVLREACPHCGRPVRTTWVACPYCAMDLAPPPPVVRHEPAPEPVQQPQPQRRAGFGGQPSGSTTTQPGISGQG